MKEIWRPVQRYEGLYEVSIRGRFRTVATGAIKACTPMRAGYLTIKLCKGGIAKTWRAHKLVLEAFRGPCPAGKQTRHRNGIRHDNRICNLRWGTAVENNADKRAHGTWFANFDGKNYEDHPYAKLTKADLICVNALFPTFKLKDLAAVIDVQPSTLSAALKRHRSKRLEKEGAER